MPSTLPGLLAATAEQHGDRIAIVDGDVQMTYASLLDATRRFAGALHGSGITKGDRVGVWLFNSVEWVIAALGTFEAGATLIPVNTRFKGREAADILARSSARALVTTDDFLGTDYAAMLESAGLPLPSLETTVLARTPGWDDFLSAGAGAKSSGSSIGPDDPSDILFTSGTTGAPKGVVQTHARTLRVATDWVAMTGLHAGDRYLMVNPYFHMFGLKAGILACVAAGTTMLPEPVFDADRVLARVGAEHVTVLPGPPTLYQSLLDHPDRDRHDISTLRVAVTGAADIPVELIRRVRAELPFQTIITGYGLTEAGTATATSPDDDPETIATTVGRARPGFEMRVDAEPGHTGEILLRGGSVMSHYLDDPGATEEAFVDGWLKTGDLGVIGDDGCLRIVGRAKDMFIVGGFNAYPAEIENALLRHPDIQQVAVIGIPDPRLGEVGMAFAVVRPGATVDERTIVEWSRAEMANYKVPRRVVFLTELPINATGKVMKDALRDSARD